jgi:hypothetical protein
MKALTRRLKRGILLISSFLGKIFADAILPLFPILGAAISI